MNEIIEILMRRDGDTKEEAIARVNDVKSMMEECGYDPGESEQIFTEEFELEPDYLLSFIMDIA